MLRKGIAADEVGGICHRGLVKIPNRVWRNPERRVPRYCGKGSKEDFMIGKLAGAWLGNRLAGRRSGAKGAIIGYGAAALARRSVPTLAALTLGGWAYRKWRDRRRSDASYPSEAAPAS